MSRASRTVLLPYPGGDCIEAFLADLDRSPRKVCAHLRSQPRQVGIRQMAHPREALCLRCVARDLREENLFCHCCGHELNDQVSALVLLRRRRYLRAVASLCEVCRAWLPPGIQPLRLVTGTT